MIKKGGIGVIKKYVLLFMVWFLGLNQVAAQDDAAKEPEYGWKNKAVGSLNLTQNSFDNWSQGGENSLAWQLNFNARFENNQEKYNWSNSLKLTYGMVKSGKEESKKSVDEIKLESVLNFNAGWFVRPYGAVNAETQFSKGYDYGAEPKVAISDFLDPGYFRESIGLEYTHQDNFKTRLGVSGKQTVTRNFPFYSDDPATPEVEKLRLEFGAESVTDVSQKLGENLLLVSKLELFSNLKSVQEIDVNWDTVLIAKVARYVEVNFNFKIFYDRDISVKRQLKQALSMGLTYSFL